MKTIKQPISNNQAIGALKNTCGILEELLNSAALSLSSEARDCLEVFDQYDWVMIEGCDPARFKVLRDKGDVGAMTEKELDEFIDMISDSGQTHVYFTIIRGYKALAEYRKLT